MGTADAAVDAGRADEAAAARVLGRAATLGVYALLIGGEAAWLGGLAYMVFRFL